jgi:hypothetical protein
MRCAFVAALLFAAALPVGAQIAPPPPQLDPVPEPPPAIGIEPEPTESGPTITPGSKVEEFTTPDGKKHIRVTRPDGKELHFVEEIPGQPGGARTDSTDSGVRPPLWLILEW